LIAIGILVAATPTAARELRVCADPNNLPFSNQARQGFENRIAELIAKDLGAEVKYVWWAQRRGNVRNTLTAGECDLIPGIAAGVEMAATTRPYYRSTYVFVSRRDGGPKIASFDDPKLRTLKVGVQLIGDDFANTPPAHALARRGIVQNVRGFMLYGDYALPTPPANILKAVADRQVDVAVVWGPLAGYFAGREKAPLRITPVSPVADTPDFPMVFDIAMGVRRGDKALLAEIDAALARNKPAIDAILARYGVPLVAAPAPKLPEADEDD
jgi:mxaJ protein